MFYDKIIFYTKYSMIKALNLKLLSSKKAFYANNTVFTNDIDSIYNFKIPKRDKLTVLFIGPDSK